MIETIAIGVVIVFVVGFPILAFRMHKRMQNDLKTYGSEGYKSKSGDSTYSEKVKRGPSTRPRHKAE